MSKLLMDIRIYKVRTMTLMCVKKLYYYEYFEDRRPSNLTGGNT